MKNSIRNISILWFLIMHVVVFGQQESPQLLEPINIKADIDTLISELIDVHPTFSNHYKVNNLKKLGTVVLLDASFEWIHNRLKTAKNSENKLAKRPLFSQEKEAKKLYAEREKAYRKLADVVVDVENLTLDEQIDFIAKKCKV